MYRDRAIGTNSGNFPFRAYEALGENNPVLSHLFGFANAGGLNLMIQGSADLAEGQFVSGGFFSSLGVPPAAGRMIDENDDRPGATPVAVVSSGYAARRFGEMKRAVGQQILINGKPFTIAGVTAPGFFGISPPGPTDLYLPLRLDAVLDPSAAARYPNGNSYWVEMMGRLRPGVTIEHAHAAMAPVFHRFVESTARNEKERANLPALLLQEGAGGLDHLRRQYSKPLYVLMTLVGLILTIACANIANLLLARAAGRRREIAVRLSLGAGRLRVMRQLLTESVLLSLAGAALGLVFAHWGIRFLTVLIANGRENFTLFAALNWNVLEVTAALAVATGMLFGLAPAIQASGVDFTPALKQRLGAPRRGLFRIGISRVLVVSQIAISLLLLVAAGLFVRTLSNLHAIELGFNRENLLLFRVNARQAGYEGAALLQYHETLRQRLAAVPGVRSATLSNFAMLSGAMSIDSVQIPGVDVGKNAEASSLAVGPEFFSTMQIPILLGRGIDQRDVMGGAKAVVVNELFARTHFGTSNPLGRHILYGDRKVDWEIVGVAKNTKYNSLKRETPRVVFVPYGPGRGSVTYALRTAGDALALGAAVREIVHQADARIPVSGMVTQELQIERTIGQERTFATLCTCFAILAVLIACVGLYGTMAYNVARRTGEIGIRMALGAQRPRVMWMVMREVLALAAAALAIGVPAALSASKLVETFLFNIKAGDAAAIAGAAAILLVAALAAGYGPARRASRVDPMEALRHE
jgi:predicted permease